MGRPVAHFDIGCRDHQPTLRFYQELFDWGAEPYGPLSHTFDFRGAPARPVTGAVTSLGHEPHQYVMIYVEVDDIPACCQRAEELGGSTVIPATDLPDGGRFAWLKDPGGNLLGIAEPKPVA